MTHCLWLVWNQKIMILVRGKGAPEEAEVQMVVKEGVDLVKVMVKGVEGAGGGTTQKNVRTGFTAEKITRNSPLATTFTYAACAIKGLKRNPRG